MNKVGSKGLLWLIVILGMLAFTISRTLDFLKRILPPDQEYVAYVALAAFDLGVLIWLYYAMQSAEGDRQRAVAYGMIFVCAFGVGVTTICDLFITSSANGLSQLPDKQIGTIAVWIVSIIVILNFLAGILVHLFDPKHLRHHATEKAKDTIFNTSLKAIEQRANTIAPQLAIVAADYWEQVTTQELIGSLPGKKEMIVESNPPPKQIVEPIVVKQEVPIKEKKKVRDLPKMKTQKERLEESEQTSKSEN